MLKKQRSRRAKQGRWRVRTNLTLELVAWLRLVPASLFKKSWCSRSRFQLGQGDGWIGKSDGSDNQVPARPTLQVRDALATL